MDWYPSFPYLHSFTLSGQSPKLNLRFMPRPVSFMSWNALGRLSGIHSPFYLEAPTSTSALAGIFKLIANSIPIFKLGIKIKAKQNQQRILAQACGVSQGAKRNIKLKTAAFISLQAWSASESLSRNTGRVLWHPLCSHHDISMQITSGVQGSCHAITADSKHRVMHQLLPWHGRLSKKQLKISSSSHRVSSDQSFLQNLAPQGNQKL